jgi:hypothetical protein
MMISHSNGKMIPPEETMKPTFGKRSGLPARVIAMLLFFSGAHLHPAFAQSGSNPPTYMVNNAVVTSTSITFSATVNPDGVAGPKTNRGNVLVSWQYGIVNYALGATGAKAVGMGDSSVKVSASVPRGRFGKTIYQYRLLVTSSEGTIFGPDQIFSTVPSSSTGAAPVDTLYGSTVSATVNPNLNDTIVYFQYGLTTAYSLGNTPSQDIGSGTAGVLVSATLSGLAPNTLYRYRVVSVNGLGTVYGPAQTLATLPLYGTTVLVSTKTAAPGIAGAIFSQFGNPAINNVDHQAFQATITGPGINTSNNSGIWADIGTNGLTLIARTASPAPDYTGTATVGTFATLSDPAYSNDDNLAFFGTLMTSGDVGQSNNSGIWATTSGTLALVARAGDSAPDGSGSTSASSPTFASFSQFVLPDQGGVVFLATLKASKTVTSSNNLGIWAVDTDGILKQVVRTGNGISLNGVGKSITGLTVFTAPTASTGQTRDFNSAGDLLFKAALNDRSTSIIQTTFP